MPTNPSEPAIRRLNEDEQIDLVALAWLGRGDGDLDDWAQRQPARTTGGRLNTSRASRFLAIISKKLSHNSATHPKNSNSRSNASPTTMPYHSNADLPSAVRGHLPPHAQDIYREAFNHAFAYHAGDVRQEEIAHRTAWSAVKRSYVKMGDQWVTLDKRHQG